MKNFLSYLCLLVLVPVYGQVTIPYTQNFDTGSSVGWTHYALYGTDNWQLGTPSYSPQTYAISSPNCWGTNLSGPYTASSSMCLESPSFDLSGVTQNTVLSFWHARSLASGSNLKAEYSIDGGATWVNMYSSSSSLTRLWYSTSGGWTGNQSAWNQSCFSLTFLNGQADVRIRLRLTSSTSTSGGWLVDNFYIGPEYFNISPAQGDTIDRFSKFFPTITVVVDIAHSNQYSAQFADTITYYLSEDQVPDPGDLYLGYLHDYHSANANNVTATLNTPPALHAGIYYILITADAPNRLAENNESDNSNFAVLIVDSTLALPYVDNFDDTSSLQWDVRVTASNCTVPDYWMLGTPYRHHLDNAHSGPNAWSSSDGLMNYQNNGCGGFVESPFIDLTTSANPVLAFWYTNYSGDTNFWSPSYIRYSVNGSDPNTQLLEMDYYSTNDDWDYQVVSLAALSAQQNVKFGFYTRANNSSSTPEEGMAFDDIYFGPPLPDVSLEGDKSDRFTSSSSATDTLWYWFVNSGIGNSSGTITSFYWSTDSLLDVSDIFIGSKAEPTVTDTSRVWTSFPFAKPTTATGHYYIFYVADSMNVLSEMREYNNYGSFNVHQQNAVVLPYLNDFETQITDWRHDASLGADDWNWGTPTGNYLDTAFSGTQAWITNAHGDTLSGMNRFHLYTPVFDFTTISNPVVEFDMIHYAWLAASSNWTATGGNMSYSTDGGATWIVLDTTSQSYKEWYYREEYSPITGTDRMYYLPMTNQYLFGVEEHSFVSTFDYQTRSTPRTTHYVLDIAFLAGEKSVQFRFNYASQLSNNPGMLMDNFSISSAHVDFVIPYMKNLKWSEQDNNLRFYVDVLNNGNYRSDTNAVKFYLSADSLLDAGDHWMATEIVPRLRPEYSHLLNKQYSIPPLAGYNYLLIECDPLNIAAESNETNNVIAWNLGTHDTMIYPYVNDFSDTVIDGWTWYYSNQIYNGYRFRHKVVEGEPVYQCETDMWFLDRIDHTISNYNLIPTYYLETPEFSFAGCGSVSVEFDLLCVGNGGTTSSGGNMEYSIDGGNTWIVLNTPAVLNPVNWYNAAGISTLGGAAGWTFTPGDTMMHCYADLAFLSGAPSVKFRFTFRSKQRNTGPGVQGMRIDNFTVNAWNVDYVATVAPSTLVNAYIAQPFFPVVYDIVNTGTGPGQNSYTKLYWSTDTILDAGDSLVYSYFEFPIPAGGNINSARNIYYPVPIVQLTYYLFYFTDGDSGTVELSELNNVSYFEVVFDSLSNSIGIEEYGAENSVTLSTGQESTYLLTNFSAPAPSASLMLYDSRGALVYSSLLNIPAGNNQFLIPVALSTGMYFVKLEYNGSIYCDHAAIVR